jgi:hypothetical protein
MNPIESLNPDTALEVSEAESKSTQTFMRIVTLSTAAPLGFAVAAAQSLRLSPSGFSFQISTATFVAFLAGAIAALLYWRIAAHGALDARRASLGLAVVGVGLFLYPLRFVPSGKLLEIAVGLGTAACALSIVGFLLLRVKRFLDADARRVDSMMVQGRDQFLEG